MLFENYFSLDGNRWKSRLAKAFRISNFDLLFESISNKKIAKRNDRRIEKERVEISLIPT